jgi:hypothetical protein
MAGGHGGAAPPPKQEELQPHPVRDQLPSVSYCITSPPPWRECLFNLIYLKDIYLVYAMNTASSIPLKRPGAEYLILSLSKRMFIGQQSLYS